MKLKRTRKKTRKRRIIAAVVVFLLVASVVFAVFSIRGVARFSNITSLVLNPVALLYQNVKRSVLEGIEAFSDNKDLIEENRRLKETVNRLQAQVLLNEIYLEEIEEYKQLLNLQKELSQFELITARVVFTTIGNVQTGITIDKGISKEVDRGMPVLFGDKLFCVVKHSDLLSARVRTIFEKDFAVIARNSRNHEIIRVRGGSTAYLNQLLICDFLPLRSDIMVGDAIETSALGGIYPNAIKIGEVVEIVYDRDQMPVRAYIRPYVNPAKVDLVNVLVYKELWGEQIEP